MVGSGALAGLPDACGGPAGRVRRRCALASVERSEKRTSAAARKVNGRRRGAVECILKVFRARLKAKSKAENEATRDGAQSLAQARG